MADAHKNFAYSTVATAPSPASSGTSLVVAAGDGSKFPTPPFNATVWPASTQPTTSNAEIVRVTAISTDTLTIARTQESSSARTIVAGDQIAHTVTAKTMTDAEVAGSNTQIQYNNNGVFGAEAGFEYDAATNRLKVNNSDLYGADSLLRMFNTNDSTTKFGWWKCTYDSHQFGYGTSDTATGTTRLYIGNLFGATSVVATASKPDILATADLTNVLDDGSGNMSAKGRIVSSSATGGFGYATGAGGVVTQATNKATGVTLNKVTGEITMNAAALAAGAIATFVLSNSAVAAGDMIVASHHSGGTIGPYLINARVTGAGAASIAVRNTSAGSLSEAIVIKFAVIKAVTA